MQKFSFKSDEEISKRDKLVTFLKVYCILLTDVLVDNHENTAGAIYAQCEGILTVIDCMTCSMCICMHADPTAVKYKEVLYDHPKTPSPQPPMQPCEAYSVLPDH